MTTYNLCIFPDDASHGLGHIRRCEAVAHEWDKQGTNYRVIWGNMPRPKSVDVINVALVDSYTQPDIYYRLLKSETNLLVAFQDHLSLPPCIDIVISCQYGRAIPKRSTFDQVVCYGPAYVPIKWWLLAGSMNSYGFEKEQKGLVFDCDSVKRGISPAEFSKRMAQAEIVICSSGLTAYEAVFMNKTILLRIATDEQLYTYMNLIRDGYALPMSPYTFILAKNGKWRPRKKEINLVDGRGAQRIVQSILDGLERKKVSIGKGSLTVWSR